MQTDIENLAFLQESIPSHHPQASYPNQLRTVYGQQARTNPRYNPTLDTTDMATQDHRSMATTPTNAHPQYASSHLTPGWHSRNPSNSNPYAGPWNALERGPARPFSVFPAAGTSDEPQAMGPWEIQSQSGPTYSDSAYGTGMVKTSSAASGFCAIPAHDSQSISVASSGRTHSKKRKTSHARAPSRSTSRSSQLLPPCIYCSAEGRTKIPRNRAEQKKHELTHTRPFACKEASCRRGARFATHNDLDRHQTTCHGMVPKTGTHHFYRCSVPKCSKKEKLWDRKDNFKQHIQRTHKHIRLNDVEKCVTMSQHNPTEAELYVHYGGKKAPSRLIKDDHSQYSDVLMDEGVDVRSQYLDPSEVDQMDVGYDAFSDGLGAESQAFRPNAAFMSSSSDPYLSDLSHANFAIEASEPDYVYSVSEDAFAGFPAGATAGSSTYPQDLLETAADVSLSVHAPEHQYQHSSYEAKYSVEDALMSYQGYEEIQFRHEVDAGYPVQGDETREVHRGKHQCPDCAKVKDRLCDLNKHMKRHSKPFGCTFPKCKKRFGSKNDWKRHENSQHVQVELWRCDIGACAHSQPARLFYDTRFCAEHLQRDHGILHGSAAASDQLKRLRLGPNGHDRFWCGFCGKIVAAERCAPQQYHEVQNQRLRHIGDHFDLEAKTADWVCLEMNVHKKYLWDSDEVGEMGC